jgi:3-hydroxy-9,10-secoandrosta-1,3,5(10)-triene-9,17-dione monooxygenase
MGAASLEELIERARALAPGFSERSQETERLRRLPDETIAEIRESGLLRAVVPTALGGSGLGVGAVIEITREVGEACGSTAWCIAVCTLHNGMVSSFPDAARRAVFAFPEPVICGVFLPSGEAVPAGDGGYRLRGEWDFASTCDHADFAILGAIVRDGDGPPRLGNFLLRRSQFQIEDNWYVAGLCGTGSKRVVVEDASVPADWTNFAALGADAPATPEELAVEAGSRPVPPPATSIATLGLTGVALGVARGAVAAFQQRLSSKLRQASFKPAEQQVGPQLRLAEAAVDVEAAELIVQRDCAEMVAWAERGLRATAEQRGRYRRDAAWAFQTCTRAVARLQPAAGAHSIFLDNALQRAMRDLQVMSTHVVADPDAGGEAYARALLGLPRNDLLV